LTDFGKFPVYSKEGDFLSLFLFRYRKVTSKLLGNTKIIIEKLKIFSNGVCFYKKNTTSILEGFLFI